MSRVFAIAALTSVLTTAPLQAQQSDGYWELGSEQTGPSYIVLATDVSSSMNEGDPLIPDEEGVLQALRDDAQVTFLQLLPFVRAESYVGVVQFAYKVRYCHPGEARRAVKRGEPALLPWYDTELDRDTVRALVRSIVPESDLRTRVEVAMDWADERIALARERHGDGPAMLVLLTDGDPTNARYELSGVSHRVEDATKRLHADDIRVYPIIINRASWRPTQPPSALSEKEEAAERLMERVARATEGKTYRITRDFQLVDIFSEILGAGVREPTVRFAVSSHHRTAILIGTALRSVEITPAGGSSGVNAYSLPIVDGVDTESGIGRKIIPLTRWTITILRRPADLSRVDRYWCGEWRLVPDSPEEDAKWRVYLIPDMFLRLSGEPASPWWAFEQVRVRAELVERPKEIGEGDRVIPLLEGKDLSLSFEVAPIEGEEGGGLIEGGRWDSARVYTSDPLHLADGLAKPGRYRVICKCVDHVGQLDILLGRFGAEFEVQPVPLSLQLRKARDNGVVLEVPGGRSQAAASCRGEDQVYAELIITRDVVEGGRLAGELHLAGLTPGTWPFTPDASGRRAVTERFTLPVGAAHLVGWVEIKVETPDGVRNIRLPDFDLPFSDAPLRLERQFSDRRRALWVGELHQQTLTLSVLPVSDEKSSHRIKASFPTEFSRVSMRVTDTQSGVSKWVSTRCRREAAPRYEREEKPPRVVATYRLESVEPIPPSDRCEIELGAVIAGLEAEPQRYDVVDPVHEGIFIWRVFQDPASRLIPGVDGVLYRGERVRFAAEWNADHDVSAVRFEIERPDAESMTVDLSPSAGGREAHVDESIDGLTVGETYPVYVNVALGAGVGPGMNLRLYGGEFRVENRQLELTELSVGETPGLDIECRALEEVTLPLRAGFRWYVPGDPQQERQIERFKASCVVRISTEDGVTEDYPRPIRWTPGEQPPEGPRGVYRFDGEVTYIPEHTGRSTVEFGCALRAGGGLGNAKWLSVREPRLFLEVRRIDYSGEKLLFDTRKLVAREPAVFPATTMLAMQLGVRVRRGGGGSAEPWPIRVEVRRSSPDEPETVESREEVELSTDSPTADWKFPVKHPGRYVVRLFSAGSKPGQPRVDRRTPDLLTITRIEPEPIIAPSSRLTKAVRQWPFKYRVPIPPDHSFLGEVVDFEFHLPGDTWRRGIAHKNPVYKDGTMWLVVESPEYLPLLEGSKLEDGPVEFRLRYRQEELITWEHRHVTVVGPVLTAQFRERCADVRPRDFEAENRELTSPVSLEARPKLLLEPVRTHWTPIDARAYVWRNPGGDLATGKATPEALAELVWRCRESEKSKRGVSGDDDSPAADRVVREKNPRDVEFRPGDLNWRTIIDAEAPIPLCGLPRLGRQDEYVVLFSVRYDPDYESDGSPWSPDPGLTRPCISEWSGPYAVTVHWPNKRTMPICWWGLAGLTFVLLVVQCLKLAVVRPENLGLRLAVSGGESTPAAFQRMSWRKEFQLRAQPPRRPEKAQEHSGSRNTRERDFILRLLVDVWVYLQNAWVVLVSLLGYLFLLAPSLPTLLKIALRRGFLPVHRSCVSIRPHVARDAQEVQTALLCVATRLGSRIGRLGISNVGWESLPEKGEAKSYPMKLAYKLRGGAFDGPVTVNITG